MSYYIGVVWSPSWEAGVDEVSVQSYIFWADSDELAQKTIHTPFEHEVSWYYDSFEGDNVTDVELPPCLYPIIGDEGNEIIFDLYEDETLCEDGIHRTSFSTKDWDMTYQELQEYFFLLSMSFLIEDEDWQPFPYYTKYRDELLIKNYQNKMP